MDDNNSPVGGPELTGHELNLSSGGQKRTGATIEVKPCFRIFAGQVPPTFFYLVVSQGQASSPSSCPPSKNSLWGQLGYCRIRSSFLHSTHSTSHDNHLCPPHGRVTPRSRTLVISPVKPHVLKQEATLPPSLISPPSRGHSV